MWRTSSRILGIAATLVLVVARLYSSGSADQKTTVALSGTSSSSLVAVVRVVDGDTIVVDQNGKDEKVRFIGVDTPEIVDPRKPLQCFGKEASAETHRLLDGKLVNLGEDPSQGTLDKYGRTLAYVFLPDGTNVNEALILTGFAHEYTYHLPYKYQAEFKAAERVAREAKRGLWADGACS
jgi:micrococcal nuclease